MYIVMYIVYITNFLRFGRLSSICKVLNMASKNLFRGHQASPYYIHGSKPRQGQSGYPVLSGKRSECTMVLNPLMHGRFYGLKIKVIDLRGGKIKLLDLLHRGIRNKSWEKQEFSSMGCLGFIFSKE